MVFTPQSDIARFIRKNPETGEILFASYYSKLSFTYTFKEQDEGKTVAFAYAIPYGYTDLIKDLDELKDILVTDEAFEHYASLDRLNEHGTKIKKEKRSNNNYPSDEESYP